MKYKITSARKNTDKNNKFHIGIDSIKLICKVETLPEETSESFDFGSEYDPYSEKIKRQRLKKASFFLTTVFKKLRGVANNIRGMLTARISRRRKRASATPILLGAFCATLTVALVSAGIVIYKLVIKNYFGSYESFTVPGFVGESYPFDENVTDTERYNITVNYEYSSDVPEGEIISQIPPEGVTRRIYRNKTPCELFLTVSLGERTLTMNDYSSFSLRDAILELKNESVAVKVKKVYSNSIAAGTIISTSPATGEIFSCDEIVTLTVSLGPEIIYVSIPNVYALTEARAEAIIKASGLKLGRVSYVNSEQPAGTVISQSPSARESVREGTAVEITVSAGIKHVEKLIPDLYGLTVDEAREMLAEIGLVLGSIYGVANGAPKGTVVSQSLLAGMPIPSGITSIDIYVSS